MLKQTRKVISVSLIFTLLVAIIAFATIKLSHKRTAAAQSLSPKQLMLSSEKETNSFPETAIPFNPKEGSKDKTKDKKTIGPTPFPKTNKAMPKIREKSPTEAVFPEIELPALVPESEAPNKEIDEDKAIFEQDDTDFIDPPFAEEG